MKRGMHVGGAVVIGLGMSLPAVARPSEAEFKRFLHAVPQSRWQVVPDSAEPGLLFAGRVNQLSTIVRARIEAHQVVGERIEVSLPQDTPDDQALAIMTRFISHFVDYPGELKPVMSTMRTLRRSVLGSGQRSADQFYRDARITLSLDSSAAEFNPKTMDLPWGMLYWKAEVVPLRPARKAP